MDDKRGVKNGDLEKGGSDNGMKLGRSKSKFMKGEENIKTLHQFWVDVSEGHQSH